MEQFAPLHLSKALVQSVPTGNGAWHRNGINPKDWHYGRVSRLDMRDGVEHIFLVRTGLPDGARDDLRCRRQVSQGRDAAPGVLEYVPDGWYDTGDIASVDEAGFVSIVGRVRRFAKIGGEMVSMEAAEALVGALWPEARHAVVSVPDPRKGEALLLVTTHKGTEPRDLLAFSRERGIPELMVPRAVLTVPAVPLLTRRRHPFRLVRLPLEMCAGDERLVQVARVFDDS